MTTRAAIYLRISLDAAMDGLAIDRQRQDCEALAEQRGWDVVHTYVDQSISASKKDVDRPDYDAMVASFERGEIDAIICWDLDRLTRQPAQLEEWIDRAEEQGLKLVTANGDADLATDGGRMYAREYGFWDAKARSYFTVNRCHTSTVIVNDRRQRSIDTRGGQKSIAELWATNLPGTKDSYYYNFC